MLVVDVILSFAGDCGSFYLSAVQVIIVIGGILLPPCVPLVKMRQFYEKYGRLYGIESEVAADQSMVIFGFCSIISEFLQFFSDGGIICDYHSAIAHGTEILVGEE